MRIARRPESRIERRLNCGRIIGATVAYRAEIFHVDGFG
jgi:hypothetical protein